VCLRQPPPLRSLASYTVFHIENNFSDFTLSSETLYGHYVRAAGSNIVPVENFVPESFPHLRRSCARGPRACSKRYHKACVDPSQFPWYAHTGEYCASNEEIIARFCTEKHECWCDWCNKPLFATVCYANLFVCNKYSTTLWFIVFLSTPSPDTCIH